MPTDDAPSSEPVEWRGTVLMNMGVPPNKIFLLNAEWRVVGHIHDSFLLERINPDTEVEDGL
jgi:hypothetical protein